MVKKPGRPIIDVDGTFYVREPDRVMLALSVIKNTGRSWTGVRNVIGYAGSVTTVWKVAKGLIHSRDVARCLGMGEPARSRFIGDLPQEMVDEMRRERDRLEISNGELLILLWTDYQAGGR